MGYKTFSSSAPGTSGALTSGDINTVHNNPLSSESVSTEFPTRYDALVNKNNVDLEVFVVSDEKHLPGEIGQDNSLYLHHRIVHPQNATGASIAVSQGAIVTGLTDYNGGRIYFGTNPTSEFTVSYIAQPDPVHSAHINVLQDSIMKIQSLLGATTNLNNGIRTAQYLLYGSDPTGSLLGKLPNAIGIDGFDESTFTIRGETGLEHDITIGNSYDQVHLNASLIEVLSSGGRESVTGSYPAPATGNPVLQVRAESHLRGQTTIGEDYPHLDPGTWIGSGEYTGAALRVLGDTWIGGALTVTGDYVIAFTTGYTTGSVIQENLTVSGDATIREDLNVGGNLVVDGSMSVTNFNITGEMYVGRRINFLNSFNQPTIIDGMDPSFWHERLEFMNRDSAVNSVMMCKWSPIRFPEWYDPQDGSDYTGFFMRTWTGVASDKVIDTSGNWIYSTMETVYAPAGIFEDSIFNGELHYEWQTGPLQGQEGTVIKLESLNDGNGESTGCRFWMSNASHYSNAQIGNRFAFFMPGYQHCSPSFIDSLSKTAGGDPKITISATNANPLVLNVDGQIRRINQSSVNVAMTSVSSDPYLPATGDVTAYLYSRSVGNIYQSEFDGAAPIYALPYYRNVAGEMMIGEVRLTRSASAWDDPGDWRVVYYAPDSYYDSGWMLTFANINGQVTTNNIDFQSITGWGNGHLKSGPESFMFSSTESNSKHITLTHNIGDERKLQHTQLEIMLATSYWKSSSETPFWKYDFTADQIKKYVYKITDPQILFFDRYKMKVSFSIPSFISQMWTSWADIQAPAFDGSAPNGPRAYARFVIRPTRQTDISRQV